MTKKKMSGKFDWRRLTLRKVTSLAEKSRHSSLRLLTYQIDISSTLPVCWWSRGQAATRLESLGGVMGTCENIGTPGHRNMSRYLLSNIQGVPKKMSFLGKTAITTFKIIQNAKAGGVLENSGYLLPDEH